MQNFNLTPELNAMKQTALSDLISAKLLWNVGLMAQSIWSLQQSAEKYLKVLYSKNNIFSSLEDWDNKMKGFNHRMETIFNSLDTSIKNNIKSGFITISLDKLRYKASFGYSYQMFLDVEKFINEIRCILGDSIKSYIEEWKSAPMRIKDFKNEKEIYGLLEKIFNIIP